jgi:N-acetylmuramoyl-L-alanine amidase
MEFQRNVADRADGIVGLDTLRSLERMRPALDGPSRAVVREEEAVRSMRSSLAGSTIAIDAAYGPRDPGAAAPLAGHEAELTLRLAAELAAELRHRGAATLLLRDAARDETPSDRAQAANRAEATICVSLHLTDDVPDASGASCAYWGSATTHSPGGRRLAEVIQRELDRMGLPDGGIRPLTISLLRETRMPAVLVEPCHHVDADGQICLADPAFRRKVVRAIAEGIEGFFAAAV